MRARKITESPIITYEEQPMRLFLEPLFPANDFNGAVAKDLYFGYNYYSLWYYPELKSQLNLLGNITDYSTPANLYPTFLINKDGKGIAVDEPEYEEDHDYDISTSRLTDDGRIAVNYSLGEPYPQGNKNIIRVYPFPTYEDTYDEFTPDLSDFDMWGSLRGLYWIKDTDTYWIGHVSWNLNDNGERFYLTKFNGDTKITDVELGAYNKYSGDMVIPGRKINSITYLYATDDFGTAESGETYTLTDNDKSWSTNQWTGFSLSITGGTGSGQRRPIVSNNATTLTVSSAFSPIPDSTSIYSIQHPSKKDFDIKFGNVSYEYRAKRWRIDATLTDDEGTKRHKTVYGTTQFYNSWNYHDLKDSTYLEDGIATGGSSNTLIDTSKSWITNYWASDDYIRIYVQIYSGTGSGSTSTYLITSNTSDTLTISGSFLATPDETSKYRILIHYRITEAEADLNASWTVKARLEDPENSIYGDWATQTFNFNSSTTNWAWDWSGYIEYTTNYGSLFPKNPTSEKLYCLYNRRKEYYNYSFTQSSMSQDMYLGIYEFDGSFIGEYLVQESPAWFLYEQPTFQQIGDKLYLVYQKDNTTHALYYRTFDTTNKTFSDITEINYLDNYWITNSPIFLQKGNNIYFVYGYWYQDGDIWKTKTIYSNINDINNFIEKSSLPACYGFFYCDESSAFYEYYIPDPAGNGDLDQYGIGVIDIKDLVVMGYF